MMWKAVCWWIDGMNSIRNIMAAWIFSLKALTAFNVSQGNYSMKHKLSKLKISLKENSRIIASVLDE